MLKSLNEFANRLLVGPDYRYLRHLIIFLMVTLITVNILWDEPTIILTDRYWAWAVYQLIFLTIIYGNMYILVPKFLLQDKTKHYFLAAMALLLFFLLSVGMLQGIAEQDDIASRTPPLIGLLSGFASFALFIIGLSALQLFKYRIHNQHKISELEKATMEVELANLQSQINPHFLFNMLNNANIMVEEDAERASEIISRFNALLQYQVAKSAIKSVKLTDEIAFLHDYLQLEKLRRDQFSYSIDSDENTNITVPPLLFVPFVENAVKHNPENGAFIQITFEKVDDTLVFECKNNKPRSVLIKKEGGIGLVNIRQRLDLLFEKKHILDIVNETEIYTIIMKIKL